MALILAIEPDRRQAARLSDLVRTRVRADLVLAETTEGALGAIGNRVPDLVLVPTLLSPQDDAALAGALRVIATAAHVNMLTIPVLADGGAAPQKPSGLLGRFRKQPKAVPTGCDPSVFAEQIKSYLAERQRDAEDAEEDDYEEEEEIACAPPEPVTEPAPAIAAPPMVDIPLVLDTPAVVETPVTIESPVIIQSPVVIASPVIVEPPLVVEPPQIFVEPAVPIVKPLVVVEDPAPIVEPEPIVERERIVEPERIVAPEPIVAEPPPVVEPVFAIEREHDEPFAYEPPPQTAYARRVEEEVQPVADLVVPPVVEEVAPVVIEPAVEEPPVVEAPIVAASVVEPPVVQPPVVEPPVLVEPKVVVKPTVVEQPVATPPPVAEFATPAASHAELLDDDDPIVLAILNYMPKSASARESIAASYGETSPKRPESARREGGPLPEKKVVPAQQPAPPPAPAPAPAAAPAPPAPAPALAQERQAPAPAPPSQSELDKLYFEQAGAKPPAPPAPRRKAKQRPEWSELVASLRVDVERMRAEGTQPAKRGQSGVRPAATAATAQRKTPKPIQDQWGLFDPQQCGFAALLAKLEEITEVPNDGTSARVLP